MGELCRAATDPTDEDPKPPLFGISQMGEVARASGSEGAISPQLVGIPQERCPYECIIC